MGSGSSSAVDGPVVVVIGAGYAGVAVAQALDAKYNVVVIDRKPFFFHNVGALRAAVGAPGFPANGIMVPLDNMLKRGRVVQAEVERIEGDGVYLRGRDEAVRFDYLIVATGSAYAFPFKVASANPDDVIQLLHNVQSHVRAAQHVTVIGGGAVGIELIGELRDAHPTKKFTLIHSGPRLLGDPLKQELSDKLASQLTGNPNTEIILNDRAILSDEERNAMDCYLHGRRVLRTHGGRSFNTDLVFMCTGAHVNNKSYKETLPTSQDGYVLINQHTFQVQGYRNVFAIGDCASRPASEGKMAYLAGLHAKHVAKVIKYITKGISPLPVWTAPGPAILVPIGPHEGAGQLPVMGGKIVGKKVARALKGKTLMVARMWGTLNATLPREIEALEAEGRSFAQAGNVGEEEIQRLASLLKLNPSEARAIVQLRGVYPTKAEDNHT